MQRIEVITGEQKRRRYTAEEKSRFVALSMQPAIPFLWLPGNMSLLPVYFLNETTYERWWSVCDRCWP